MLIPSSPGYEYGKVQRSPVTLDDLKRLQSVVGFTEDDRQGLHKPGELLDDEAEALVDGALIDFARLEAYEKYRERLTDDEDAKANVGHAKKTQCILVEDRTFLERA